MLEAILDTRRGGFHLQVACRFTSDWTVLFGPSGAGKTTLLRLMAGLDRSRIAPRSAVRIHFAGEPLTDTASGLWTRPGRRSTAFVTQQPALFPHLSVLQNVAYGLPHLDRATRTARAQEMLALVGAQQFLHRRPRDLSGGEAQRVALARALATGPRLLLLDEPFSALDGATSDALLDRLHAWLRANSVQAVLATHDASDAFATGAEVALIRDGRLTAQGPASEVLAAERERLSQRLSL